jgi:hypothetical protein
MYDQVESEKEKTKVRPCLWLMPLAFIGFFFSPCSIAQAHKLDADYRARLVQKVRVESFFSDDSRPAGAKIQVFRQGESDPFLEDHLNDRGEFEFLADAEPLRVVILAGEGHQKELTIDPGLSDASSPVAPVEHKVELPLKEVLVGVAILLGSGAFLLSWRNARVLKRLGQR